VDALNERAWTLRTSDPRDGVRLAVEARLAARAIGYLRGEAYALRNSGACRCLLQEHDAAVADLKAARELFDTLRDRVGRASTLNWIGNVHLRRADLSLALTAHLEAIRLQRAAGDSEGEGDSLNYIGNVHYDLGDMARALEHYNASLAVKEKLGSPLGVSHCLNNIGNIHGRLGDFDCALEYHTRALALKREIGDRNGEAISLINVGSSHEALSDYARALDYYGQGCEVARAVGERMIEVDALRNIGDVHRKLGDPARALALYLQARVIAEAVGARMLEVETYIGAGQALVALGRSAEAVADLRGVLALAERIDSRRLIYEVHLALSQACEAAGQPAEALRHFKEYHRVEEEVFNAASERRIQAVIAQAEIERSQREAELLRVKNDELTAGNDEKARLLDALQRQAQELERLSREDALTGLFNRRHVDAALALEWERARRFGRELAVVMADVDHFKAVNDRFSHAAGDRVLGDIARILREGTRAVDVAGRWGGEEFVLVLVETPPERAAHLAEKLRAAIEAHDWPSVAPGLRVTASFGVAGNHEAGSPAALLAAADARLYQAKRAGRNRVVHGE
jgi:diguanylate cyclase (GGDEF)-like protein